MGVHRLASAEDIFGVGLVWPLRFDGGGTTVIFLATLYRVGQHVDLHREVTRGGADKKLDCFISSGRGSYDIRPG